MPLNLQKLGQLAIKVVFVALKYSLQRFGMCVKQKTTFYPNTRRHKKTWDMIKKITSQN